MPTLPPPPGTTAPNAFVPAGPTQLLLATIKAAGFTREELCQLLSISERQLTALLQQKRVEHRLAVRVVNVVRQLLTAARRGAIEPDAEPAPVDTARREAAVHDLVNERFGVVPTAESRRPAPPMPYAA